MSAPPAEHNAPVFSVNELSLALKGVVERAFDRVRVRGEISGLKRAGSGHIYLSLKDEDAVIDGVVWRGVAQRLGLRPEDGMEVIAIGRVTTYPARSRYQIVIDSLELAGEGALLKLLEERKRRLAEEGLFATERKRPIPYLPDVIGVVTSPTGAVVRDILHRLSDRFPRRVLVWPVAVQGEGAAQQIAAAIEGFGAIPAGGTIPRPDVLIVARGGGSLEDLWAFNEEVVVRATAASPIPVISAIGHETDTTLIDFASDRRAPTPTAAAEMAVPVRADLLADVAQQGGRLAQAMARRLGDGRLHLDGIARGLANPKRLLDTQAQRLDDRAERLAGAVRARVGVLAERLARLGGRLRTPGEQLAVARGRLDLCGDQLRRASSQLVEMRRYRLAALLPMLRPTPILDRATRHRDRLTEIAGRFEAAGRRRCEEARRDSDRLAALLESYSHRSVLARGYALARDADGLPIARASATSPGQTLSVEFQDGMVATRVTEPEPSRRPRKSGPTDRRQGSLI